MNERQKKIYQEMLTVNKLSSPEDQKILEKELEGIFAMPGAEDALAHAITISGVLGRRLFVYPTPKKEKHFTVSDLLPEDPGISSCWEIQPNGFLTIMKRTSMLN